MSARKFPRAVVSLHVTIVTESVPESLCYSPSMLADSYIVPQCAVPPRSLGALLALYEGNFIKLNALVPRRLLRACGSWCSQSRDDLELHLAVDGATRYTLELRLTYLFPEPLGPAADPDLHLRVYLDARMVEVVSLAAKPRHTMLRELAAVGSRELDRRWGRNILLGKWLDYLGDRGHVFPPN
jgi:hypothetical protein